MKTSIDLSLYVIFNTMRAMQLSLWEWMCVQHMYTLHYAYK